MQIFLLSFLLAVSSCNFGEKAGGPLSENDKLTVTYYSSNQPASLEEYNQYATVMIAGAIVIIRPDTVPVVIKTIHTDLTMFYSKIDKDGYIWLAAPYDERDVNNEYIYVINPHTERIHKAINIGQELRTPSCLAFSPDKVFLRGDRNGFSVGIGSIDRQSFKVEVLGSLDTTGFGRYPGLECVGTKLYAFNARVRNADKMHVFDTQNKNIIATQFSAAIYSIDDNFAYTLRLTTENTIAICKRSLDSLQIVQFNDTGTSDVLIANDHDYIYTGSPYTSVIHVYSKQTLEKVREIDFSDHSEIHVTPNFGFITTNLLMLNVNSFLNISTNQVLANVFPFNNGYALNLQLAEGQVLKSY